MKEQLATVSGKEGTTIIYIDRSAGEVVSFVSDADIDADGANGQHGARAAYMADDSGSEALANGGMGIRNGVPVGVTDWWKDIVVVENGRPKVFAGGVIVSKTAYKIDGVQDETPSRYVDSETVPYAVVPPVILQKTRGIVMGSECLLVNTLTGQRVLSVVADVGPRTKTGEVSIAAAKALGIPSSPRTGGEDRKIVKYEIRVGKPAVINGFTYKLKPYGT